jgi:hypothetical protein
MSITIVRKLGFSLGLREMPILAEDCRIVCCNLHQLMEWEKTVRDLMLAGF